MECRFGRWYLAGKKTNVIMWQSRSVQSGGARGEAGREALALPQKAQRYDCGGDNIIKNEDRYQSTHLPVYEYDSSFN